MTKVAGNWGDNGGGNHDPRRRPSAPVRSPANKHNRYARTENSTQAKVLSSSPIDNNRGYPMAFSPQTDLPEINGHEGAEILAEMIRAAFPGLTTAERCRRAGAYLDLHPRNVRRLEAGETRGDALHFYRLMKRIGLEQTLVIIEKVARQ